MNNKLSVLLVEDNQDIAQQILGYLSDKGMVVDYAYSGKEALSLIKEQLFDLVILDLMLPDIDGYQLCGQLKEAVEHHLPILMLTARDSLTDKIKGFEMGADDYLTKPFALEEVYMRTLALSRRVMLHQNKTIEIGDLTIDVGQRKASRCGQELSMSQTDFSILKALVLASPNAISKRELNQKIWGDDSPETDVLRSHIYTLRSVVDKPFDTALIKTVHGIGFKINTE